MNEHAAVSPVRTQRIKQPAATIVFVCAITITVIIAAIVYTETYGTNVPSWDDWDIVPAMTRHQPVTVAWLWSQHNEHRIPLARLIMLAAYRLYLDLRVCMYLNVILMGVLAVALMHQTSRLRGRLAFTDLFYPLVLLSFAHGLNFIWAWQVEFFASTGVTLAALMLIAGYRAQNHLKISLLFGLCLVLLALSGAHGLALVPALTGWLLVLALRGSPDDPVQARRSRILILALAVTVVVLFGLYFVGYERVPYFPTTPGIGNTLNTAWQFLTLGFGPAIRSIWPASGVAMLALLVAQIVLLLTVLRNNALERVRASGLLLFLGAMIGLGLAIGLGRDGFEPRYVTLAVPVQCCLYLISVLYLPNTKSKYAQRGLLICAGVFYLANLDFGLTYGRTSRAELGGFQTDMAAGTPPYRLLHRYHKRLFPNQQLVADYLPFLRSVGFGQFELLRDNPSFHEIVVPLDPDRLINASLRDGIILTTAGDAALEFRIPNTIYAAGLRLKYTVENKAGTAPFLSVFWRDDMTRDFTRERSYFISPAGDRANWERGSWSRIGQRETETTFWVCDRVREIRIQPDLQPCELRLVEVVLLVTSSDRQD